MIAGIWVEKFDQLAAFQNFLIMPLTMLVRRLLLDYTLARRSGRACRITIPSFT
jgi:hypothetical protein